MAEDLNYSSFGMRVRACRKQLGITQVKLGALIDVTPSYIGHLERGLRAPSADVLIDLCNAMKVSPEYLLQDYLELDNSASQTIPIDRNDVDSVMRVAQFLKDSVFKYKK